MHAALLACVCPCGTWRRSHTITSHDSESITVFTVPGRRNGLARWSRWVLLTRTGCAPIPIHFYSRAVRYYTPVKLRTVEILPVLAPTGGTNPVFILTRPKSRAGDVLDASPVSVGVIGGNLPPRMSRNHPSWVCHHQPPWGRL